MLLLLLIQQIMGASVVNGPAFPAPWTHGPPGDELEDSESAELSALAQRSFREHGLPHLSAATAPRHLLLFSNDVQFSPVAELAEWMGSAPAVHRQCVPQECLPSVACSTPVRLP